MHKLPKDSQDQQAIRDFIPEQIKYAKRGQIFALIVVVAGFAVSCFLAFIGQTWLSFACIIVSLGVITAQFLNKETKQND